jgi:enoyl-CoA hydratase/carnithine racemase
MMIMAILARTVPRRKLLEMMLLGERIGAKEAAEFGLVSSVVPQERLDASVEGLCAKLAAKSPLIVKLGLQAFHAQDGLELSEALPMLRERLGGVLATNDAREGLLSFLGKRPPRWTGT